jgi:thiol-disulfide isomerase/thioredoxin
MMMVILLASSAAGMAAQDAANVREIGEHCRSENAQDPAKDDANDDATASADLPEWMTIELTEADTGETFTLADFAGCTILVEAMATWCGVCFDQFGRISFAVEDLANDRFVVVALSVEAGLPDGALAEYKERTGFDFLFTVGSVEMLEALVDAFGRSVMNPPATPHFYIAPDGTHTDLLTGGSSIAEVVEWVEDLDRTGSV